MKGVTPLQPIVLKKKIPRTKSHKQESFEIQIIFTNHMVKQHPDNLFKCQHCDAIMKSPNSLFKHHQ